MNGNEAQSVFQLLFFFGLMAFGLFVQQQDTRIDFPVANPG